LKTTQVRAGAFVTAGTSIGLPGGAELPGEPTSNFTF